MEVPFTSIFHGTKSKAMVQYFGTMWRTPVAEQFFYVTVIGSVLVIHFKVMLLSLVPEEPFVCGGVVLI